MTVKLRKIIEILETAYPPDLQEDWDKNGLIAGDPNQDVGRVLVAVDPVQAVVEQAQEIQAQLIVTHHPLFLRGANFLPVSDPKGKLIYQLNRAGIALYNCHTNADAAPGGVADALAELVGLVNTKALIPQDFPAKGEAFPAPNVINAAYTTTAGANETAQPTSPTDHADEKNEGEPVTGLGRVGFLPEPITLRQFAKQVAAVLPASAAGLLVGGDLDDKVQKIVVSGGSGDSFLSNARQVGADVYLCADLRHHPASEHLEGGKPYLLNATHWASEWPFVPKCVKLLQTKLGDKLKAEASQLVTEPWTGHFSTGYETE